MGSALPTFEGLEAGDGVWPPVTGGRPSAVTPPERPDEDARPVDDPDAPGNYVDDEESDEVPEPNEPG